MDTTGTPNYNPTGRGHKAFSSKTKMDGNIEKKSIFWENIVNRRFSNEHIHCTSTSIFWNVCSCIFHSALKVCHR